MEDSDGDLSIQRDAILSELYHIQLTTKKLVQDLRSLVALTDPEEGKLFQSQETALKSLDIWKTLFAAAEPKEESTVE